MTKYKKHIKPKYDELTVYMHGISFLMLAIMSPDFWKMSFALSVLSGKMIAAVVITIVGVYFSIVSPFSKKKRAKWEKAATLGFIILSNIFIGLYALAVSADPETHEIGLFQVPILINVLYSLGLMFQWGRGTINESDISDARPPVYQVRIITFAIVITFAVFTFVIETPWAVTYSWSIFVGLVVKHVMDYLVVEITVKRVAHEAAAGRETDG